MADVPLLVISESFSSERRITPAWTISQLRTKLEPITGIPPSSQRLFLKTSGQDRIAVEAADEDNIHLSVFPLSPYAELHVSERLSRWIDVPDRSVAFLAACQDVPRGRRCPGESCRECAALLDSLAAWRLLLPLSMADATVCLTHGPPYASRSRRDRADEFTRCWTLGQLVHDLTIPTRLALRSMSCRKTSTPRRTTRC